MVFFLLKIQHLDFQAYAMSMWLSSGQQDKNV